MDIQSEVVEFLNNGIFIYALLNVSFYLVIALVALISNTEYKNKISYTDYDQALISDEAPSISIIAPAYNESLSICENIRSLLAINYKDYEVIIVNDGSKDETLQLAIEAYDLEDMGTENYQETISAKKLRGIYKSKKLEYSTLTVLDKENGGKADALNVGLNYSTKDLVACIDVDCVLLEDSMTKMVKPFLDATDKKVIASGGFVRIANNCEIRNGKLIKVNLPSNRWARFQTLEYIRAFLLSRMAWGRINGLMLISGAFGLFDKEIAIACGGYDHGTVGEDMELVVRMRKYMHNINVSYTVDFIPDPLCWTEAPEDLNTLMRQRNRWTRGTIETLLLHKDMLFNPKYKTLGLLSFPYWLIFEWLPPIVEFLGVTYFVFLVLFLDAVNWHYALNLMLAVYLFSVVYSMFAVIMEIITFHQYPKYSDCLKLIVAGMLEPFMFHPFMTFAAVRGNYDKLSKKKSTWGAQKRKGFAKSN